MLEPGSFINAFDKYIVFIYRMDGDLLYGVRIYQPQPNKPTQTIIAQQGEFVHVPGHDQLMLKLLNGATDEPDLNNPNNFYRLNFQKSFITMNLSKKKAKTEKKFKAMTLRELSEKFKKSAACLLTRPLVGRISSPPGMVTIPFAIYLSGLPFCRRHPSQGQVRQSYICFIIRRPLLHFFFSLPGVASQNVLNPIALMWMPDALALILAVILNWKLCTQ